MPILALLESIRSTLMDWFSEKRQLEAKTSGLVVRKVASQIQDMKIFQATHYRIKHRIDTQYEVKSNRSLQDYLVNIGDQTCSCRQWQAMGIPYSHSIGVIVNSLKDDPQLYAKPFYTLNAFNNTYAKPIMHPNSNIDYSRPLTLDSPAPIDGIDNELSGNEVLESESGSDSDEALLAPIRLGELVDAPTREKGLQRQPLRSDGFKGV